MNKAQAQEELRRKKLLAKRKQQQAAAAESKSTPRGLNVHYMRKLLASLQTGGNYVKLDVGAHLVRFLPAVNDKNGMFATYVERYWFDRPDGTGRFPLVSPRTVDSDAYCPAREAWVATAEDREADDSGSEGIGREEMFLANVLIYEPAMKVWEPKVLQMSSALFREVLTRQNDVLTEDDLDEQGCMVGFGIADPKKGRVVKITRIKKKSGNPWTVGLTDKTMPVTPEQMAARVDFLKSRDCKPASVEELEKAVCHTLNASDISEVIGDSSARVKASKKVGGAKPRKQEEEDATLSDDDDEDVDIDEEVDVDTEEDDIDLGDDDDDLLLDELEDDEEPVVPAPKKSKK